MLQGKRILVTGVLNDASIAFSTARLAQEQGAEVVLSSFGRVMRLTERTAKRLPEPRRADRGARRHQRGRPRRAGRQRRRQARRRGALASRSRRSRASAAGSSTRRGRTSSVALHVSAYSLKALDRRRAAADEPGRVDRRASTSTTTTSRGRSTTGWACRRRRSSRSPATSPATSARRASGSTS